MVSNYLEKIKIEELVKAHPVPVGFYIRNYKNGEEYLWAEIESAAGEFSSEEKALEYFLREFGEHKDEMEERCFFMIEKGTGRAVGTTTAWYNNNLKGEIYGRIHWVAVHPAFQGKKLAKPLLASAMLYLSKQYNKAYLISQTTSYKAVNMYMDFGFRPEIENAEHKRAWEILEKVLGKQIVL